MSAFLVVRVSIDDVEAYRQYMAHTPRIINQYGGRMIVRGGAVETLEGPEETHRIVIIAFPSMAEARTFYSSPEYQKAKALRDGAGEGQFFVVDGYAEEAWLKAVAESDQLSFGA